MPLSLSSFELVYCTIILLLAYGSLHPDAPIACGVTVGSALDYTAGASGFIYYVSREGVTGVRSQVAVGIADAIARMRSLS